MSLQYVVYDYWEYGYAEGDAILEFGSASVSAVATVSANGIRVQTAAGAITGNATSFTALATSPSITPTTATSKILVSLSTNIARQGSAGNAYFAVYRNGTTSLLQSGQVEHFGFWNDYSAYTFTSMTWQYLDSPAVATPVYYQIQGKTDGAAVSAVVGGRGLDETHTNGVIWTLMEIAA